MKLAARIARGVSLSLVPVAVAIGAVACGGSIEQPAQTSASATKAPVGTQTHGIVHVVGDALGDVALRSDQRTAIEQLMTEAENRHAPTAQHRRDLATTLADQIERGSVDRAALQPKIDALTADAEKVAADDRAALVKLHDLLDKDQRNAFVDALQGRFKGKHGEGPHGPREGMLKMKQLGDELKLTEDQRSQIKDVLHQSFRDAMREHHERGGEWKAHAGGKGMLEAFRQDTLDPQKLGGLGEINRNERFREMAGAHADRVVATVEKILPILTPEQRKIAADKLRSAAASGEPGFFLH